MSNLENVHRFILSYSDIIYFFFRDFFELNSDKILGKIQRPFPARVMENKFHNLLKPKWEFTTGVVLRQYWRY